MTAQRTRKPIRKRTRKPPSPPDPDRTYRIDELAAAVALPVRTIRYYIQRGLLPATEFRGPNTVYTARHRRRFDAVRVLQERELPLDDVASLLDTLTEDQLDALARGEAPPALTQPSLASLPPIPPRAQITEPPVVYPELPPVERRRVFRLAPGLELHLADDAPAEVLRRAEQIVREHSTRPTPRPHPRSRKGDRA